MPLTRNCVHGVEYRLCKMCWVLSLRLNPEVIQEVTFYDQKLTDEEMMAIYAKQKQARCP